MSTLQGVQSQRLSVCTSGERLANHLMFKEIGVVGKMVKGTEMDASRIQKLETLEKFENWCRRSRWVIRKLESW